jgi:hypothetical protein
MQNEKERTQSSDTVQDDVIVAIPIPSTQSDATMPHYIAEPNTTGRYKYVQVQYWGDEEDEEDDEEDEPRSCLVAVLTNPVPYWVPLLLLIVNMVTWPGWPWNKKPRYVAQSIKLTQTADRTCIEFGGVSTICWDQFSKEGDAVKASALKIDPASGQITIAEQHVL